MKRILLPALLALSSLVGTTSLSTEVQAAGIDDDPGNAVIFQCIYKQHGEQVYTKSYNREVDCPVYSAEQMEAMTSNSAALHKALNMQTDDHGCTVAMSSRRA